MAHGDRDNSIRSSAAIAAVLPDLHIHVAQSIHGLRIQPRSALGAAVGNEALHGGQGNPHCTRQQ